MNKIPELTQEENRALDSELKRQVNIIGGIAEVLEPRIFTLLQEHIQNTRNIVIISGALATFSIAFSGSPFNKDEHFLTIGVIGLLLTVIFGILYLNKYTSEGLNSYIRKYKESTEAGKIMSETINQFKEGEIDKKKLLEVAQKVDGEQRREFLGSKVRERSWKKDWTLDLLSFLVVFSLLAIIISFISPYINIGRLLFTKIY